jgi:hypothetical protein
MSGSDLAPFIAVVLRDRTLYDIQNGIDRLNELLDERLLVQITGQYGTPVHYEGSMKDGSPVEFENGDGWFVQVDDNDVVLPLNSISGLEIWMGGIFLHRFVSNRVGLTHDGGFDQATIKLPQMGQIGLILKSEILVGTSDPLLGIMATFGPILYADYQRLPREMAMGELMLLSRNGTARDLMIQGFAFRKSKIRGIISILEKLGISTTKSATTREIATGIDNEDDNGGRHEQHRLR